MITLIAGGIWAVVSMRADITANAVALKGLEDKHTTFAARVADDFKRVQEYVRELFDERRRGEPPARRK